MQRLLTLSSHYRVYDGITGGDVACGGTWAEAIEGNITFTSRKLKYAVSAADHRHTLGVVGTARWCIVVAETKRQIKVASVRISAEALHRRQPDSIKRGCWLTLGPQSIVVECNGSEQAAAGIEIGIAGFAGCSW